MSNATIPKTAVETIEEDVHVIDITPELAQYWLGHNTANRRLKPSQVDAYARDMREGRWLFNGEAIKFSGPREQPLKVQDGQNRLHAILKAKVTVRSLVIFNLPDNAQATMDSGSKRTAADNLTIGGIAHAAVIAAVGAMALRFDDGWLNGYGSTVSNARVLEWIEDNPDIALSASVSSQFARKADVTKTLVAYTHLRFARINLDDATRFWRDMAEKVALPAGDPVLALSGRFATARRNKERVTPGAAVSAIIRTWNARRLDQTMKTVQFVPPVDSFPRIK